MTCYWCSHPWADHHPTGEVSLDDALELRVCECGRCEVWWDAVEGEPVEMGVEL